MRNKVIFTTVVIFTILEIILLKNTQIERKSQDIIFSASVKGCAGKEETELITKEIEQEPTIEVIGNKIIYPRAINHLCCRKVDLKKEINNSTINIYEVWSWVACKCICFSEIEAKLENLLPGEYIVKVYKTGVDPASTEESIKKELIISKKITIK